VKLGTDDQGEKEGYDEQEKTDEMRLLFKKSEMGCETDGRERLFDAGIGRTDRSALRFVEVPFAFDAFILVNDVIFITLGNGLNRANGFAGSAIDARIDNMQGH
jgi:hypothetical protein